MNNVSAALTELQERGEVDFDALQKDEMFITVLMQATQAALRNHQEEKLEALQNAVLNTALGQELPEESLRAVFIDFVDALTVWHIRILRFLQNPREWVRRSGIDWTDVDSDFDKVMPLFYPARRCFPELRVHTELYQVMTGDLSNRGLTKGDIMALATVYQDKKAVEPVLDSKYVTDFGEAFLRFIERPKL